MFARCDVVVVFCFVVVVLLFLCCSCCVVFGVVFVLCVVSPKLRQMEISDFADVAPKNGRQIRTSLTIETVPSSSLLVCPTIVFSTGALLSVQ